MGLVEIHSTVGVVKAPQEINENEYDEEREEGNEGLEDGLSLTCIVLASHTLMLMQGRLSPGGCDGAGLQDSASGAVASAA